jgi:N-acetylglucosamine kinase-like BadF-type ATPase
MGPLNDPCLLALDGGNSKTDVLLVAEDGTVIARARAGAFVPHIVGAAAAVASLADAVAEVLASAPGGRASVVAGYLANADLPEEEEAIADAIAAQGWADHIVVGNDTLAMLRTGTDAATAVGVVCGAGINCVGTAPGRADVRYPALGRITGDWGGGFGIGKEVLWHATRAEDGRGPATGLAALVARHFERETAVGVATGMHLGTVDSDRMHEIVPLLFQAVDTGDAIAEAIARQQADEIGLLVTTTLRRLDLLDEPVDIVLGGGMLTSRHPALLGPVVGAIRRAAPRAVITIVDAEPVLGSALLGLEHLDALTGRTGDADARRRTLRTSLAVRQEARA